MLKEKETKNPTDGTKTPKNGKRPTPKDGPKPEFPKPVIITEKVPDEGKEKRQEADEDKKKR